MSTGSGSARRSRMRLVCCIMAGALLVFAFGATSAEAKTPKVKHFFYLALGDSISYGYSLVKFTENLTAECATHPEMGTCEPPSAFEPGLASYVFGKAKTKKGVVTIKPSKKETTINLSCPGETSSGLIGETAPCGWHNSSHFRRHFEYGSVSQLEAAAGLVHEKPAAVNLVSINIGSNDELHVLGECRNSLYREAHGYANEAECVGGEAPALFGKILTNIGHTIGGLRFVGYTGDIVILGFYNPFGVLVHSTDALQEALNGELENQVGKGTYGPGVKVANPYPTFNGGHEGGAGEKAALTTNTEFYNPAAIADELAKVTKGLEEKGGECKKAAMAGKGPFNNPGCTEPGGSKEFEKASPSLAEVTGFLSAFGQGCAEGVSVRTKFEDSKCEVPNAGGNFQKVVPTLAEAILENEVEGEPNLAIVTKAQEEHGSPNLAEVETFQEEHGHPNLEEATEFTEKFGVCGAKLGTETGRFEDSHCTTEEVLHKGEYERVKPNLKEAIEANEAGGKAFYVHECEVKTGKNTVECEVAWFAVGKSEYEAAVKVAFDAEVEAGFDAAVKAGFDAAVKAAFDHGTELVYDARIKFAFDKEVKLGYEAAGSPGDIHPSKAGYQALGNLVKANK